LIDSESLAKKDFSLITANLDPWKQDFLTDWLASGNVSTAPLNFNAVDVAVALRVDKKFNTSYNKVRKILDRVELMKLEEVSEINALAPKNMVERLFRLKSLDRDRYADRGQNVGANVQVNIAFGDGVSGYTRPIEKKSEVKNANLVDKSMKNIVSKV
jgi:uncharacterized alkaline shock family protein YloU